MADQAKLVAEVRTRTGKGAARSARREGRIPAVVYGNKIDPQPISVNAHKLNLTVNKGGFLSRVLDLEIDGKTLAVIPRDYQAHPVTDVIEHVDFLRISKDSTLNVFVPVVFLNEEISPGLKRGGVLNIVRHEVELICSPASIPSSLELDLAEADIGDSLHISAVTLPEGVKTSIQDRDFTIATLVSPSAGVEAATTEEEGEEEEESTEEEE